MKKHLVYAFRGHLGGGHHQVAFVFARSVVGNDNHLARGNGRDGVLDGIESLLAGATHDWLVVLGKND